MPQRIAWFALIIAVAFFSALANSEGVAPSQSEIVALLSAREYAELDRRLTSVQEDYKHRVIDDVNLREAFRGLYFTTSSLAVNFDEWVQRFPKSYVAYLARGIYYKKIGQERRGPQAATDTSVEQFRGMEQAFERASADLKTSLLLDEKPLLSLLHQINIYKLLGEGAMGRELLDRSVQIDKGNYVVRYAYMDALQSPWGGNVAQMKAFLHECREARLSAAQLRTLEALVAEDEAWTQRAEGNNVAAARAYRREATLSPQGSCIPCGPIHKAADALFDEKKYSEAIKLYSKVLLRDPHSIPALNRRGFGELQLEQWKAAFRDFRQTAELGDAYGQDMLGRMFLSGSAVPQDRDKAIEWFKKAADQGYEPAQEMLYMVSDRRNKVCPGARGLETRISPNC